METVRLWEETVSIPTYEIGKPDKNPMFLEKRVYQGSSGRIYPYPAIDRIYDEKKDKEYKAVFLENEYLKVMILPELGGRIQRAYDKTNGYDFVYYNHVIKPALVGLTGPWISGGIEFNWPQHHRPTTFLPVDTVQLDNEDGSKSLLVNDVDQMYGTKGIAKFTLYPGKAYIEIEGQLYNRTAQPQTFLWWANPAVAVNDRTQSIFPPDVHAVMDHGKRDVSRFPIATGVYYKHDYSEGVDISRYKNIPVPTSYMAEKSAYDFVGGYDYGVEAGILHVADHHISPGKKQWTWGCGDFGKAWDRNLTDEDGPYIELMTGVFTDNQPDFTWLKPFEEKTFKQYFMPYKKVGGVKNATVDAAINLTADGRQIRLVVYATGRQENAEILLKKRGETVLQDHTLLSPVDIYEKTVDCVYEKESELTAEVWADGRLLVAYTPLEEKMQELPQPAKAAKDPEEIRTNEELYLTGLHLEQYRHATYRPEDYYLEGLKRDSGDIRINNAYGALLMRRGDYQEAKKHFHKAISRLTGYNPNPYDSEPLYNLGLALFRQGDMEEAYDSFYKASWSNEQQEMAFYFLAAIDACRGEYGSALEFAEKSLVKNAHNIKARGLRAYLLGRLERKEEALTAIRENLKLDPFDYVSGLEEYFLTGDSQALYSVRGLMRNTADNHLMAARDFAEFGAYAEALDTIRLCSAQSPLLKYYEGYYLSKMGRTKEAGSAVAEAEARSSYCCFPNKAEDIAVLGYAAERKEGAPKACYYLGCLFYDKGWWQRALKLWQESVRLDSTFPTAWRNLSLVFYNKLSDRESAREALEKAFALDTMDARVFLELDQLYKKLGMPCEERLDQFRRYPQLTEERDDLFVEMTSVLNMLGQHEQAYKLIMGRKFHPWEGGEGKVTGQYTAALVEMAKERIRKGDCGQALRLLQQALCYPENLGEGKLEGTKDNHIHYYLGCVYEMLGEEEKAKESFLTASVGNDEPAGMMYYNDQPADMILYQGLAKCKLSRQAEANARFYRLIDYGEQHIGEKVKMDYFAVSLPDFLIFEENLTNRNKAHCFYLLALGYYGLGDKERALGYLDEALRLDPSHMQCRLYRRNWSLTDPKAEVVLL